MSRNYVENGAINVSYIFEDAANFMSKIYNSNTCGGRICRFTTNGCLFITGCFLSLLNEFAIHRGTMKRGQREIDFSEIDRQITEADINKIFQNDTPIRILDLSAGYYVNWREAGCSIAGYRQDPNIFWDLLVEKIKNYPYNSLREIRLVGYFSANKFKQDEIQKKILDLVAAIEANKNFCKSPSLDLRRNDITEAFFNVIKKRLGNPYIKGPTPYGHTPWYSPDSIFYIDDEKSADSSCSSSLFNEDTAPSLK